MQADPEKLITLRSSDGETFEVLETVAKKSETIKNLIEDDCADGTIPLHNVTSPILSKVIVYCNRHVKDDDKAAEDKSAQEELKKFDAEFVRVDHAKLFDIIMAANYLNIPSLLDLTCQTVADIMKEKTVEEIREMFHVENDFSPEEEEEVRREHPWAFEK